jgi:hypothetical protein
MPGSFGPEEVGNPRSGFARSRSRIRSALAWAFPCTRKRMASFFGIIYRNLIYYYPDRKLNAESLADDL